jgi:hypothetical protein
MRIEREVSSRSFGADEANRPSIVGKFRSPQQLR